MNERHHFSTKPDEALVRFWNDGDGSISWLNDLEAELVERGYVTRSSDPDDGLPRVSGERLVLRTKLRPDAIIATWINEERTRGFQLQANGDLVEVQRERPSDMWSPAEFVGPLRSSIPVVDDLLQGLVA